MIVAKNCVLEFIKGQPTLEKLADRLGTNRTTLYNILNKENVSSDMIEKLLKETGFSFDKAFELVN